MTAGEIKDTVRAYLTGQNVADISGVTDESDLFEAQVLDSFGILSIVMFIEERFGIALETDDLTEDNFRSLDTLARLIAERSATGGSVPGKTAN